MEGESGLSMGTSAESSRRLRDSLDEAYSQRGLFYSVLSRLSAEGLRWPFEENQELIHDFIADSWEGLAQRYDPAQARFTTYLYAAFWNYARRRILARRRYEASALGLDEVESPTVSLSDLSEADLRLAREEISRLSPERQELIRRYFGSPRVSERDLARDLGLSRYALKKSLVETLGLLATRMLEGSDRAGELDWEVAVATWAMGFTPAQTARRLGIEISRVREARQRNVEAMTRALPTTRNAATRPDGEN